MCQPKTHPFLISSTNKKTSPPHKLLTMSQHRQQSSLNEWSDKDKPRERLKRLGVTALADYELLALMFGSGVKGQNVIELSKALLNYVNGDLAQLSSLTLNDLTGNFKGIGEAKALHLIATLEFGRRRSISTIKSESITNSTDIKQIMFPILADLPTEQFWIILLNRNLRIISKQPVASGGISGVAVDIKTIFKPALERSASAIAICHNHPSGGINPSREDINITNKICQAAKLLDIQVIDHIIITPYSDRYYSFADNGQIP